MKVIGWHLATLLVSFQSLFAGIRIEEAKSPIPCRPLQYTVYDMGETTVGAALMSPFVMPQSLAPHINNAGQVTANRDDEGYVRDLNNGELVPQIGPRLNGFVYGISNAGDILSSIVRDKDAIDWTVWTQKNLRKEKRFPIATIDNVPTQNVHLRALNASKWAVGYFNPGAELEPVVWNPCNGLKPLGWYLGWPLRGVAFGISDAGTIVGYVSEGDADFPFVWNEKGGYVVMRYYKHAFEAQSCRDISGRVHFVDMVVTDDNYVYGTFWMEGDDDKKYFAYRWEPYSQDFRYLELGGMRINGTNKEHTLVGALNGEAVLRAKGREVVPLKNYVTGGDDWVLLEATDINDHGDIVGYGKYKGSPHVFLLKKK